MPFFRRPIFILLLLSMLFSLPALACGFENLEALDNPLADVHPKETAAALLQSTQQADDKVIFTYTGEKQIYHQDLFLRTIFLIDYDYYTVVANESAPFELPFGCQTARGTDSVNFNGKYEPSTPEGDMMVGDIVIRTDLTATGCDMSPSTVEYQITGQLTAVRQSGIWVGQLSGTVTRKQTWEDHSGPESDETYPILLSLTGTSVK